MEGTLNLARVLIAARGALARRLLAFYRKERLETVAAFSEADADATWVGDADYDAYLGGRTAAETYLDPSRVVSAAMDAGCEALHPGAGRLAGRLDLISLATSANLVVLGVDASRAAELIDQVRLLARARKLGLPTLPASERLGPDADGIEAAARIGLPLMVKAAHGGVRRRVTSFDGLGPALASAREEATRVAGDAELYLELEAVGARRVTTVLVGDRRGRCIHLGETDGTLGDGSRAWVEEMGVGLLPAELHRVLGAHAVRLAVDVGLAGVGFVRWAVADDGRYWVLGLSSRLPAGYALVEAVQGIDLIEAQHLAFLGRPLEWQQQDATELSSHGMQLRLLHVDPTTGGRPDGVLTRLSLPGGEGIRVERGADEGQPCTADTDPLLATVTVLAADRAACVTRLREALARVEVEGVVTNLDVVRERVGRPEFLSGSGRARRAPPP